MAIGHGSMAKICLNLKKKKKKVVSNSIVARYYCPCPMDLKTITLFSLAHCSSNVKVGSTLKKSSDFTYQAV